MNTKRQKIVASSSTPVTAWGLTLGYLPYRDVRSSLGVSRIFLREVPNEIEALNIFSPAEMDVPTARKFENVVEVNIFCLCCPLTKEDHIDPTNGFPGVLKVCPVAVSKIVPFLQSFPKLQRVTIGYFRINTTVIGGAATSRRYFTVFCPSDYSHSNANVDRALHHGLLRSLCGAFEARSLRNLVALEAISTFLCERVPEDRITEHPCTLCRRVCANFPFRVALCPFLNCLDFWEKLNIVSARPGGCEYLKQDRILLSFLEVCSLFLITDESYFEEWHDADEGDRHVLAGIRRRITLQITMGRSDSDALHYFHIEAVARNALQRFVRMYSCNPNAIDSDTVLMAFAELNNGKIRQGITKSALIFLQGLNFQVRPEHFAFVVDDSADKEISAYHRTVGHYNSDEEFARAPRFFISPSLS